MVAAWSQIPNSSIFRNLGTKTSQTRSFFFSFGPNAGQIICIPEDLSFVINTFQLAKAVCFVFDLLIVSVNCVGEGGDKVPGWSSGSDAAAAEVGGAMAANSIDIKKSGNISRHLSQGICDGLDIHKGPSPLKTQTNLYHSSSPSSLFKSSIIYYPLVGCHKNPPIFWVHYVWTVWLSHNFPKKISVQCTPFFIALSNDPETIRNFLFTIWI